MTPPQRENSGAAIGALILFMILVLALFAVSMVIGFGGQVFESFAADLQGAMTATAPPFIAFVLLVAFMIGMLPIPIGYERGKVRWLMWCATGQHPMVCYWTRDNGFQTLHPDDRSHGGDSA